MAPRANWLDQAFAGHLPQPSTPLVGDALVEGVWGGGYPEALARTAPRRRTAWARQYLEALVQRDARAGAGIDRLDDPLPRLLRALGQIAGDVQRQSRIAQTSCQILRLI